MSIQAYMIIIFILLFLNFIVIIYIRKQTVAINSKKYNDLSKLNSSYIFNDKIQKKYSFYTMKKTLAQARDTDPAKLLIAYFSENFDELSELYLDIKNNEILFNKYSRQFSEIMNTSYSSPEKDYFLLSKTAFIDIENGLCKGLKKETIISPSFELDVEYISQKGYSHYTKTISFSLEQYWHYLDLITKTNNEKNSREAQRRAMTQSMRYDIMKRDNFRCSICGRGRTDGVTLHVDHILPVSKGGLTEPSNLRTLCNECNMGKRDKFDPYGIN